jgi:hypothetical protein
MPRTPYKEPTDDEIVERLVPMPGWVYKKMIARAKAQQRTTKYQIGHELERIAKKMNDAGTGDSEAGPKALVGATK